MNFGKVIKGTFLFLAAGMLAGCCCMNREPKKDPAYTGMLGPENFWRPRDNMTFFLYDKQGGGFDVKVAVRDINTYMEGKRPVYIFLVDPAGNIVDRKFVKDDGIVKCDMKYKDGVSDIWLDYRYRGYHNFYSKNHYPEEKMRSPKLTNPRLVKPTVVTLKAPATCTKGVYRLAVCASWDHFVTVTPSRRLLEGVHPGQSGLYLHGRQFEKGAYMYLPAATKDLFFSVTEELYPRTTTVTTPFGKLVPGEGFLTFRKVTDAPKDKVIKISADVKVPGTMLHIFGAPMIFCETEEAAKAFANFEDPAVTRLKKIKGKTEKDQDFLNRLCGFDATFCFKLKDEKPVDLSQRRWNFGLRFRSNWWDFGDGSIKYYSETIPPEAKADAAKLMEQWVAFRYVMDMGLCMNQWGKIAQQMAEMYRYTKSPLIKEAVEFNVRRMCTLNGMGRANPEKDTWLSGYEPDNGMIAGAVMAESRGHDAEYNQETEWHLTQIYKIIPMPEIPAYQEEYYKLKTHITVPRQAVKPVRAFSNTVNPTDTNCRTRSYSHKPGSLLNLIHYGDLWGGTENKEKTVWPAMEKGPFVRVLANRYAFINTGRYYAIVYLHSNSDLWNMFTYTEQAGDAYKLIGFGGVGYGGWQLNALKAGGISAIWVPECGPALMSCNHNAMYSNILWGKVSELLPPSEPNVERDMTMESQAPCTRKFDPAERKSTSCGSLPRTGLEFQREVIFKDDHVNVKITVTAKKDTQMKEFYESIPLYVEQRIFKHDGKEMKFPKAVVSPSGNKTREDMAGYSGLPPFKAKKLELTSKNGKGICVEFASPQEMTLTQVLKYRAMSAPMSGVSVKLPVNFKQGQKFVFEYTIRIL